MTVRDLHIEIINGEEWLSFRFGSGEDFNETLIALKQIPLEDRDYLPTENHLWRVKIVHKVQMMTIFANFASAFDALKSQKSLF